MPYNAHRRRVNAARKAVVAALAMPRGMGAVVEPLVLMTARALIQRTCSEELLILDGGSIPDSWTPQFMKRIHTELRAPEAPHIAALEGRTVRRLKYRGADRHYSEHLDVWKKLAEAQSGCAKYIGWPRAKLQRHLAWRAWQRLSPSEQEVFILDAKKFVSRSRTFAGQFSREPLQSKDVPDSAPICALLGSPEQKEKGCSEISPMKEKHGCTPKTLVQIGANFMTQAMSWSSDVKIDRKCSVGAKYVLRNVATSVMDSVRLSRRMKLALNGLLIDNSRRRKRTGGTTILVPGARGKRLPIMSEAQLHDALELVTNSIRQFRKRSKRPFRVSPSSLTSSFNSCAAIHTRMSYRTLSRRLSVSKPRMGYGVARKSTDRCPCCHCYDHAALRDMRNEVQAIRESLVLLMPDYFENVECQDVEASHFLQPQRAYCHASPD